MWLVATAWAGVPPADPCTDTESCQAARAVRVARFAEAVGEEPAAQRLPAQRVAPEVLVDRSAGLVYVLDPGGLVALALDSGVERWRIPATGSAVYRVGTQLAVSGASSAPTLRVTLIDPGSPGTPRACAIVVPTPAGALSVEAVPFDRGGVSHLWWRSWRGYEGGTPPGPDEEQEAERADACGILALAPDCAAVTRPLKAFVWNDPARDLGRFPARCGWLNPFEELPAAAASEPAFDAELPRVAVRNVPGSTSGAGCPSWPARELVVEGPAPWTHRVAEARDESCAP